MRMGAGGYECARLGGGQTLGVDVGQCGADILLPAPPDLRATLRHGTQGLRLIFERARSQAQAAMDTNAVQRPRLSFLFGFCPLAFLLGLLLFCPASLPLLLFPFLRVLLLLRSLIFLFSFFFASLLFLHGGCLRTVGRLIVQSNACHRFC